MAIYGTIRKRLALVLLLAAAVAEGASARAAIVVSHPLDPNLPGQASGTSALGFQGADDFVLSGTTSLTTLTWYGAYEPSPGVIDPTDFSIRFFVDAGGAPAVFPIATVDVSVTPLPTGLSYPSGIPWIQYSTDLAGLTLGPGLVWLSIVETSPATAVGGGEWYWGRTNSNGPFAGRAGDGQVWMVSPPGAFNLAFTLESAEVPEPTPLPLLGSALALAHLRRKPRGRRAGRL